MNRLLFGSALLLLLAACAGVQRLEPPKVEIFGFEAVPHQHGHTHGHDGRYSHGSHQHDTSLPGFRIGVFVRNPNDININPSSLQYRITLEDDVILSGRMTDLQRIEGLVRQQYDFVFVPHDPDQVEALHDLLNRRQGDYDYELDVRVSFVGYGRDYTAQDSGEIDLHNY